MPVHRAISRGHLTCEKINYRCRNRQFLPLLARSICHQVVSKLLLLWQVPFLGICEIEASLLVVLASAHPTLRTFVSLQAP